MILAATLWIFKNFDTNHCFSYFHWKLISFHDIEKMKNLLLDTKGMIQSIYFKFITIKKEKFDLSSEYKWLLVNIILEERIIFLKVNGILTISKHWAVGLNRYIWEQNWNQP